jgi:hypothetical protein
MVALRRRSISAFHGGFGEVGVKDRMVVVRRRSRVGSEMHGRCRHGLGFDADIWLMRKNMFLTHSGAQYGMAHGSWLNETALEKSGTSYALLWHSVRVLLD